MAPTFSYMATGPKLPLFPHDLPPKSSPRLAISSHQQQHRSSLDVDGMIKTHILKSLPADLHPSVASPMRRLISAAPPTLAPALCLAACDLVGGNRDHAIDAACCMHLVHVAFHVHARLVLGNPNPKGIELMTGDGILPFGYEMLTSKSELGGTVDPARVLRAVVEVASATGARGAVEGQLMEVLGEGEGAWVRERKEGRVLSCSAACGAILGGGSDEEVERLRRFGLYVGMMMVGDGGGAADAAAAETFGSLARLELRGFERERAEEVQMLVDSWRFHGCTS